ncbi:lytic transglycosylase domain-containing protein [Sphingomonas sp. OTU376]|uniref:lytic transglycosylase domain-containing protein n=1 Tax=Sphingomonas sp. OTU376 TaxID=3043863 RepID=UPI00313B0642
MRAISRCRAGAMRAGAAILLVCAVPFGAAQARKPLQSVAAGGALPADALMTAVTEASRRFGIPEMWIWSVIRAESGGNPRAVSPAGAMGLMQLMPATWGVLSARYGLGQDPFDIRANVLGGTAYLREMLDRYGNPATALAAYNAGPGRVDDWRTTGRRLPAETTAYVRRIVPTLAVADIATPELAPPSWRDAALFAGSKADIVSSRELSAPSAAVAARNDGEDGRSTAASRDVAGPANLLFVPLSGQPRL